jgi:hypothetical protein
VARLQLNNIFGTAAGNGLTFVNGSTTAGTWASAPGFPTIAYPDLAVVIVDYGTANEEIVYLTAYTAAATSGTFLRGQENTSGVAHSAAAWNHGPTALDFSPPGLIAVTLGLWR